MPSNRAYLRRPEPHDTDEFLERVRDSGKLHGDWVAPPDDAETFHQYVSRLNGDTHDGFLVCRRDDDAIAGVINVNEIVRGGFQSAYLGYYGFEPFAGQGYMTDGLELVLDRAFTRMGLHRLEANVQPDNLPSRRLVERVGFRLEGFSPRYLRIAGAWRDHERWAITVEDWREARATER